MPERTVKKNRGTAVLLINLGSPESPSVADVRRYLREFLMDGYVIDIPYLLRWIVVHLFILPFRPKRTAAAYRKIWSKDGSPLLVETARFARQLQKVSGRKVYWAMRYGSPSVKEALQALHADGNASVIIAPLYPQHALSSTVTAIEEAKRHAQVLNVSAQFLPAFFASPAYLDNLAARIRNYARDSDHILFSYHGLPVRQIRKTDPTGRHCLHNADCCLCSEPNAHAEGHPHLTCYRHQALQTTAHIAEKLRLKPDRYSYSFQSRLGRAEWLKPMTADVIQMLAARGVRRLAVVAPAFVAENLETLEEVDIRFRELFLAAGGERFTYIPCLNADAKWVTDFAALIDNAS